MPSNALVENSKSLNEIEKNIQRLVRKREMDREMDFLEITVPQNMKFLSSIKMIYMLLSR